MPNRVELADDTGAAITAANPLPVNLTAGDLDIGNVDVDSIAAGDNNIGNVDIVTVPADPFGLNADSASASGSISAKLRAIATALGITAFDLGSGTGGTRTLRVFLDTATGVGHNTTGLGHGVTTVTTAGTDVALAGSTACKWVMVQAQTDNTNKIAVGATGVDAVIATGTGILLDPGEDVTILIDNLADVFIDSLVNGEGVRYMYGT